jgi:hypothetical protein
MLALSACEYRKASKTLVVSSALVGPGFPEKIEVKSHHTGKVIAFVVDVEAGIACEFWDGEECHYVPVDPVANVEKLVVSNFC